MWCLARRSHPNEGIRRSVRNGLGVGLLGGLGVGLGVGLLSGLLGGLFFGLNGGWAAVIQHYTLRLLLWRSGAFPRDIAAFCDSCVQRILLRRVGGGWIFVHRLLLEYFAELEDERATPAE
jgi:hypothetical protein